MTFLLFTLNKPGGRLRRIKQVKVGNEKGVGGGGGKCRKLGAGATWV